MLYLYYFLRVGYGIDTLSPHDFAIKQMTTKNNVAKNFEPWYPKWIPDNNSIFTTCYS